MATTQPQATDLIIPTSTEEKLVEPDKKKEQHISTKNERPVSPSQDVALGPVRNAANQSGSFVSGEDRMVHPPTIYAPQAHAVYYKGYDNSPVEWNEYPPYINVDGLDMGSSGIYNDNPLLFHTGYGYSPQMPYGPYSPATTPLPSVGGDAQLYSHQQYPFSGQPYYQRVVPPSMPYITSPTPVSQPELNTLVNIDQQVDGMFYGPRPSYPSPVGTFGRGNFSRNSGMQDLPQGFDSFRYDGLWSNWPKPSDRQRSATHLSPSVSPQTIGTLGSLGQNLASPQPRSFIGFGSGTNSYNRGYMHGGWNQTSSFGGSSISSLGTNGKAWFALENSRRRGRGGGSLCSCGGTFDILSEQNRGPRSSKPKNHIANDNSPSADGNKHNSSAAKIHESYNCPDFATEYKDAKFFIIKSYSEDNVHKSIKYGIWASTPNGNRKLDAAYREAKDKSSNCPVFLLFSVNASSQFCGVAEMIGPVDFDKSVDFWQQDKWSGQFPAKWHIIKDVPNSQFRHIVLENNDNKPVTNSRDTQEVKLEHGTEMLNIFKNYETNMSILDDFDFYEDRQKAMEERKARQQASAVSVGVIGGTENRNAVTLPNNFINQMSKSFAQVLRLDESGKEDSVNDRAGSVSDGSMAARVEDTLSVVSNAQTN